MTITTSLDRASTTSMPGTAVPFALRLNNPDDTAHVVRLRPVGGLAEFTVVDPSSVELAPASSVEVGMVVTIPVSLAPGSHTSEIAVSVDDVDVATAEVRVDVATVAAYIASIAPATSRSASKGRHRITVANRGNVPVDVSLSVANDDPTITVQPDGAQVTVLPGETTVVDLVAEPVERFWNGPAVDHEFVVLALGSDEQAFELHGTYQQRPRLRPWWGPALAGAAAALLIAAVLWFAVLAPWVRSTADSAADDANAADRAALNDKIDELDAAAAEAKELPLGEPADLRLAVETPEGDVGTDSFRVGSSVVWSVTDVIFQNPTGAAGRVALMRDDEIVMESELANFRDLDFHLVAPLVFTGGSTIQVEVTCDAPGPGQDSCSIGTTLAGFTDESS
jgi:hypothetical protein